VSLSRRTLIGMLGGIVMLPACAMKNKGLNMEEVDGPLYGLIGQMKCLPGKRAELISILSSGTNAMPGCVQYVIAEDAADTDAIWITEIWTKAEYHQQSLQLPAVQAAIAKGRPLITGFGVRAETRPISGNGLGSI
jgi:quinol monooxygenase YgiN